MGNDGSQNLPHPLPHGKVWLTVTDPDGVATNEQLLRPDFSRPFNHRINRAWHKTVESYIRTHGHRLFSTCTAENLAAVSNRELRSRLSKHFNYLYLRYVAEMARLRSNEGTGQPARQSAALIVEGDKYEKKMVRHTVQKSRQRLLARNTTIFTSKVYDFMFVPSYQSSDDSDPPSEFSEPEFSDDDDAHESQARVSERICELFSWLLDFLIKPPPGQPDVRTA